MKNRFFSIIAASFLLASCSSVYRSSQTPDDVYYSPAKQNKTVASEQNDQYQDYTSSSDDNYLRMKVEDRYRWSNLDDYDYWYSNPYNYGYNSFIVSPFISLSFGSYLYNPYLMNNWYGYNAGYTSIYGYNPYYPVYYYKNQMSSANSNSLNNLNAYGNHNYNNSNYNNRNYIQQNNQPNNQNNFGNLMRKVFSPNTSNNNLQNSWSQPVRTFTPSASPNISTGGHSGGFNSSGSSSSGGRIPH
ncbi:MAG: hypothetical protein ACR2FN_01280 [Chitinophagaceae bacterium]